MGAGRALPDLAARGRRSAHAPAARGVRRPALLGSLRRALARAAERPAAVARGPRPGPALAAGGLLRDADARPARGAAAGGGARGGAVRRRPGQPHPAQHTRERRGGSAGGGRRRPPGQAAPGGSVEIAYADKGYPGARPAEAAAAHGLAWEVVKPPAAKRGFVLLPRRWVVERSFAWMARCRRLARDCERLPETLAGFHFVAFTGLMLRRARDLALVHNTL